MSIGAAVAGQTGVHQPQAVEQLCPRAEGGADAGNAGTLVEGQGGGNIKHLVYMGLRGLGHTPPGIGGQGLQIAPGTLGVQNAQGQRGFPGAGYSGDSNDLIQRYVHINIFQVVYPRPAYFDAGRDLMILFHWFHSLDSRLALNFIRPS